MPCLCKDCGCPVDCGDIYCPLCEGAHDPQDKMPQDGRICFWTNGEKTVYDKFGAPLSVK